tara:strand:+ start:11714 stop:12301 length:588 start_codon:yes stop_codon:yes gene_type:complete
MYVFTALFMSFFLHSAECKPLFSQGSTSYLEAAKQAASFLEERVPGLETKELVLYKQMGVEPSVAYLVEYRSRFPFRNFTLDTQSIHYAVNLQKPNSLILVIESNASKNSKMHREFYAFTARLKREYRDTFLHEAKRELDLYLRKNDFSIENSRVNFFFEKWTDQEMQIFLQIYNEHLYKYFDFIAPNIALDIRT